MEGTSDNIFQRAFTLIEIVVAIAIITLIASVTLLVFNDIQSYEALSRDTTSLISHLERARTFTLSGKNGSAYGVHIDEPMIYLFEGTSYSESGEIQNTRLRNNISIKDINIANASSTIVFDKLTGTTDNDGTITLGHTSTKATTTVVINKTGIIERQSE